MSCPMLNFGLCGKNCSWGVRFFWRECVGRVISFSKKYKPVKQDFSCTRNMHKVLCDSGCMDYCQFLNFVPRDVKDEFFVKETKKCKLYGELLGWKIWIITVVPKIEIFLILKQKKCGFAGFSQSYTKPHFFVQSAKQTCLVTGQGIIWSLKVYIVRCNVRINVIKS